MQGDHYEFSDDSSDDDRTYGSKRQAKKRNQNKENEVNEDEGKLQEFMAQQKTFWEEVDDSNLFEEEVEVDDADGGS